MINLFSVAILAGFFFALAASHQQQTPGPFFPWTEASATREQQPPGPLIPVTEEIEQQQTAATVAFAPSRVTHECWTEWFDRDNPSGSGDWETLKHLRRANPGKICRKPRAIEVQTLTGLTVAETGDVIYRSDTTTGFVCRNRDQRGRRYCKDYRVRFSCYPPYCVVQAPCWTDWFDRDNPSGTGDWETLGSLRRANPGKICPYPEDIEVQTLTGLTVAQTGDRIYRSDTTTGFVCRNRDQRWTFWSRPYCQDYRIRFSCRPPFCGVEVCWTNWYDRDNPSGTGDWELLRNLRREYPGQICAKPLHIEAVTTDTNTPASATGDNIYISSPTKGFVCRKRDQRSRRCRDYKVRFGCPC